MNPFDKISEEKKINRYLDIERGTSFAIPVCIRDENDNPIVFPSDEFQIYFTLKENKFDFDYDDEYALIKKAAVLGDAASARYDILLSSKDTWLPPGTYYFDIMLKRNDDIYRLYFAETRITEAPSNRYQTDNTTGYLFSQPISIGAYRLKPVEVKLAGTFVLNYKDIPLNSSPKFLLTENKEENIKEIQHFTSRMRFPLILEQENYEKKIFIFNNIAPYNFIKGNPLGEIRVGLEGENLTIWSIPLKSQIKFYGSNRVEQVSVGKPLAISLQEDFIFHITFENHLLIISGRRYESEWPLMIEWFDFNK